MLTCCYNRTRFGCESAIGLCSGNADARYRRPDGSSGMMPFLRRCHSRQPRCCPCLGLLCAGAAVLVSQLRGRTDERKLNEADAKQMLPSTDPTRRSGCQRRGRVSNQRRGLAGVAARQGARNAVTVPHTTFVSRRRSRTRPPSARRSPAPRCRARTHASSRDHARAARAPRPAGRPSDRRGSSSAPGGIQRCREARVDADPGAREPDEELSGDTIASGPPGARFSSGTAATAHAE